MKCMQGTEHEQHGHIEDRLLPRSCACNVCMLPSPCPRPPDFTAEHLPTNVSCHVAPGWTDPTCCAFYLKAAASSIAACNRLRKASTSSACPEREEIADFSSCQNTTSKEATRLRKLPAAVACTNWHHHATTFATPACRNCANCELCSCDRACATCNTKHNASQRDVCIK